MGKSGGMGGAVLIVDLAKRFGGASVRVLELARSLQGRHPYAVATLAGSPLHQKLDAEKLASLPVPFGRGDPRLVGSLVRAIRLHGFTVLDAHNPQSQFWGYLAARFTRIPTSVATVHSSYRSEHGGALKGRAYEGVLRLNALGKTQFIAVSESVESYLQDIGVDRSRVSLIHNGLPIPRVSVASRADHPLMQALGWGSDIYLLICVARLEPVKGHRYLLEALRQVVPDAPHLRCLLVGEGRSREGLEAQAREAGLLEYVHFAGFRTDIADLLSLSNAFCLPSLTEGLPFALLEASALRLPLLVTSVGGMARLLTHQQTAFLVPPSDPSALAEGLRWLMDHPQEATALGHNGFEMCQRRFNPEEMIARTLDVYQRQA